MDSLLIPIVVGVLVIVLGIMNWNGNISTLHSYHRKRVKEEDRIPFGRKVGAGSVLIGCSIILKACLEFAAGKMNAPVLNTAGTILLTVGLIGGFAIITIAMFKYNKGIF